MLSMFLSRRLSCDVNMLMIDSWTLKLWRDVVFVESMMMLTGICLQHFEACVIITDDIGKNIHAIVNK